MEFSRASVRWGRQFHAPNTIRPLPFPFPFSQSCLGAISSHAIATTNEWLNLSADCRVQALSFPVSAPRFRFLDVVQSLPSGPALVPSSHINPRPCETPPLQTFFLSNPAICRCQPYGVPVVRPALPHHRGAGTRPRPRGAWCQMVTLPPTPNAATELPAQAGLVAAAAAATVSPGPAVEGTPHPPRHPSRSMARLRLGYTKSRTGCLRCKQRRVKVAPVTPPRPRRV